MLNFPAWTNNVRKLLPPLAGGGVLYLVVLVWYGASPKTTDVGYAPEQPVPFSHALHSGQLGVNCLYCHASAEKAAHSSVPTTETCMNCHARIKTKSPLLQPVRDSWANETPIKWVNVHDLPDFVYFNHSAHVSRGVGCVSCHGRVDTMERIQQVSPLSMGWCLNCHRDPAPHLRPVESVTDMAWEPPEDARVYGARLQEINNIKPRDECSSCHR